MKARASTQPRGVARSGFLRLIQLYTLVLVVMVVLVTAVFVFSNMQNYQAASTQAKNTTAARISDTITHNQQVAEEFATQLDSEPSNLANLNQYFSSSLAAYADYALDDAAKGNQYLFWPTTSRTFFVQHPEITRLTLALADQKKIFVATASEPGGHLQSQSPSDFAITTPLINQYTLTAAGVIGIDFDHQALTKQLATISATAPMQAAVLAPDGTRSFYYRGSEISKSEGARFQHALSVGTYPSLSGYAVTTKQLADDYVLVIATNRSTKQWLVLWRVLPLVFIGLLLLVGATGLLWLVFRRYQRQLATIIDTVAVVSGGDLDARVEIEPNHTDLKALATGINAMLEEIHAHIYTIYQLRLAQQEANIKALQAQINPHFMSNTLEYIRMAAIDADQPELAKVVYSFAALLRNNTDFSPLTTLQRELDFIEKYVFLYQVRFPDRLAYQITVDPSVATLQLPKFSLQPLVENYFVHGVDFARHDNALSIRATRDGDEVTVTIRNNGKPLTAKEVRAINQKIQEPLGLTQQQSIGMQNVYSRLKDYFGQDFSLFLESDGVKGVTVIMSFQESVSQGG